MIRRAQRTTTIAIRTELGREEEDEEKKEGEKKEEKEKNIKKEAAFWKR